MIELVIEDTDPGIRDLVIALRGVGFNTTDSGDGVSKPPDERTFEMPHVIISTERFGLLDEADRLQAWLDDNGHASFKVEASYAPRDKTALLLVLGGVP